MTAMISTAADPQRAAVLVMLLAEDDATGLLSRLSPEELRLLGSKMVELGESGPGAIADAIAGFAERADQAGLPAQDRSQDVRRLMTGAVGELKADNLMRGIAPAEARIASEAGGLACSHQRQARHIRRRHRRARSNLRRQGAWRSRSPGCPKAAGRSPSAP